MNIKLNLLDCSRGSVVPLLPESLDLLMKIIRNQGPTTTQFEVGKIDP